MLGNTADAVDRVREVKDIQKSAADNSWLRLWLGRDSVLKQRPLQDLPERLAR
jgi:hypothetical protein